MASEDNKKLAKYVLKNIGGKPIVRELIHDKLPLKINILICNDQPVKGVTTYCTLGLSDYKLLNNGKEFENGIEIMGSCATKEEDFSNILGSIAFCIIRTKKVYPPGSFLEGYTKEYYLKTSVPNIYFTTTYIWKNLKTIKLKEKKVSFLLAVPISNKETEFFKKYGDDKLEDLFEKKQIDIFDINRKSVV